MAVSPHYCPATENKQGRSSGSDKAITREPWRTHLTPSDGELIGRRDKRERNYLVAKERTSGQSANLQASLPICRECPFLLPCKVPAPSREDALETHQFHSLESTGQTGDLLGFFLFLPLCHPLSMTLFIYSTNLECLLCVGSLLGTKNKMVKNNLQT